MAGSYKTPWEWPNSIITRVVDGDSFYARLTRDIGFNGSVTFIQKLRLMRINTPPVKTDIGVEAATFVLGATLDRSLKITTLKPYKYGDEWMAEVELPDGRNLSEMLVAAGLAQWWDGEGPRPGGVVDPTLEVLLGWSYDGPPGL